MKSTRIEHHINAPRAAVYRALLDPRAVAKWKVPDGMTCHGHAFDAREGGSFRISLTCDAPTGAGKTTAHTDTYHGRFVKLVPNEQIVEVDEFETDDPALGRPDDDHDHARGGPWRHRSGRCARWVAAGRIACRQRNRRADGAREAGGTRRDGLALVRTWTMRTSPPNKPLQSPSGAKVASYPEGTA